MAILKYLLLSIAASLVNSHFLPIKEDPADALADEMVKGAGMDADSPLGPASLSGMNWKKPSVPDEPARAQMAHNRFGSHDLVKLQPIVSVTGLVAPKEWSSTSSETNASESPLTSTEPVQSKLVKDENLLDPNEKGKELLHEIATIEPSNVYSEDSQKSKASEVEKELQSMQPKQVVKVLHHDTKVHQRAAKSPGRGLAHLGESVDHYGPVTPEKPVDYTFSLHHGQYRPTAAPAVTQPKTSQQETPKPKDKLLVAAPKPSSSSQPTEAVHRPKRAQPKFPIRAEDVHPAETTAANASGASESLNTTNTSTANIPVKEPIRKQVVKVKGPKSKPSIPFTGKLENLFDANSVGGQMSADDVDKVLRFMKVQPQWNWHPFDLNGDGELSRKEFLNAAHVAERFKVHKK